MTLLETLNGLHRLIIVSTDDNRAEMLKLIGKIIEDVVELRSDYLDATRASSNDRFTNDELIRAIDVVGSIDTQSTSGGLLVKLFRELERRAVRGNQKEE